MKTALMAPDKAFFVLIADKAEKIMSEHFKEIRLKEIRLKEIRLKEILSPQVNPVLDFSVQDPACEPVSDRHPPSFRNLTSHIASALVIGALAVLTLSPQLANAATDRAALERRVIELQRQLDQAQAELAEAKAHLQSQTQNQTQTQNQQLTATANGDIAEVELAKAAPPAADKITLGPVTIGGAIRANYILGTYPDGGQGPSRGGNGGNFALDTFRLNLDLKYQQLVGKFEYRWYDGYHFLHTGWLGWDFADGSQLQVGVNRVPFGPGAYGVSQSWFFDQHFYVGLADDMDLGIKYVTSLGNLNLDIAYYLRSEWNGNGVSQDSTRYGYDAVVWDNAVAPNGDVIYGVLPNGYEERHQFNVRAIYNFDQSPVATALGVSLQYGQLKGRRTKDGHHWAASVHMTNRWNNWLLASQLTRYKYHINNNNALNTDVLLPMGAYDFAWPVAADAWLPAISLSYLYETNQIPWLDSVRPYIEYSNIVKQDQDFNDSQLVTLGAAWARGGWYIYTDLAFSDGNYFVGNETKDGKSEGYTNIYSPTGGVGDFGADGNNHWNYRFNINFGYYF